MCFRDSIRVPRIENRVPRIREIGSLKIHTRYLMFSLKNLQSYLQNSIVMVQKLIAYICVWYRGSSWAAASQHGEISQLKVGFFSFRAKHVFMIAKRSAVIIKSSRFAANIQGIRRLGTALCDDSNLHISVFQVTGLHKGDKQENLWSKVFNRKSISNDITHPQS